jgi:hypothetical protein
MNFTYGVAHLFPSFIPELWISPLSYEYPTLSYSRAIIIKSWKKTVLSGFCQFLVPKCSSRIVSASSNDDCSAQNRPRALKLVSLDLSELPTKVVEIATVYEFDEND